MGIVSWTMRQDFFVMPISGFIYHAYSQKNILLIADADTLSDEEQKLMNAIASACGKNIKGGARQNMPEQLDFQGVSTVIFLGQALAGHYEKQLNESIAHVITHSLKEMLTDPSLKKVVWHAIRSL